MSKAAAAASQPTMKELAHPESMRGADGMRSSGSMRKSPYPRMAL